MNAGFDSDNSPNNKSTVSIKLERIDQNPQFKFIDNEGQKTKRVNMLLENLSRQEHKSHLTDNNKSAIIQKSPTPTLNGSQYIEELAQKNAQNDHLGKAKKQQPNNIQT